MVISLSTAPQNCRIHWMSVLQESGDSTQHITSVKPVNDKDRLDTDTLSRHRSVSTWRQAYPFLTPKCQYLDAYPFPTPKCQYLDAYPFPTPKCQYLDVYPFPTPKCQYLDAYPFHDTEVSVLGSILLGCGPNPTLQPS